MDTILYLMFVASINLGLLDTMFFLCILQGPMSYTLRKDKHTDVHTHILLHSLWIVLGASQPSSSSCCHGFRFRLWVKFMPRENLPALWQVPWASSLWGQHQIRGVYYPRIWVYWECNIWSSSTSLPAACTETPHHASGPRKLGCRRASIFQVWANHV